MDSGTLSDWVELEKDSLEDEKRIAQTEGEEIALADETKSEDEDSKYELFKDNEDEELKIDEDDDEDDISQSKSLRSIYEDCRDDEEITKCKLYMFARADREKEDW